MFFKGFLEVSLVQIFEKSQVTNRSKFDQKSGSILEAFFSVFWTILGAILEAKIDQKTKKNEIKNKSDFKTMSYWRTSAKGPSSLVRQAPLAASCTSRPNSPRKQ